MDMTPYHGRVRIACCRESCPEGKARIEAACINCPDCTAFILDLEGKILAEFQACLGDACIAPTEDWLPEPVGATHASPAPEPEPQAAVTPDTEPETKPGGKGLKPPASSLQPRKEK